MSTTAPDCDPLSNAVDLGATWQNGMARYARCTDEIVGRAP